MTGSQLTALTRVGFAARGLLYIVIALLVIETGRSEDPSGALAEVGEAGGGLLLIVMAAGFVAYGLWRLTDAALDIEGHDPGAKGVRQRLGAAGSGVVHLLLAWQAFRLIDGGGGAGDSAEQSARTALELPGGPLLLVAAGAVLVAAGVFQLIKAAKCSFCDRLDASVAEKPWIKWMGRAGYSARGLVFIVSGFFVGWAGLKSRASEAGGMEEALTWLSSPIDVAVAAGLLLFGLFSLVEARFRILHPVPIDAMARTARDHSPL